MFRFVRHFMEKIMLDFDKLVSIAGKLSSDIDAHLAADNALKDQVAALTTENADLKAQLAADAGAQAVIDAATDTLTAADGKVAPAA